MSEVKRQRSWLRKGQSYGRPSQSINWTLQRAPGFAKRTRRHWSKDYCHSCLLPFLEDPESPRSRFTTNHGTCKGCLELLALKALLDEPLFPEEEGFDDLVDDVDSFRRGIGDARAIFEDACHELGWSGRVGDIAA